jgi:phosphoribosylaminoimidazolecarboxamide formyltransferase / IMP cyclohydrolase
VGADDERPVRIRRALLSVDDKAGLEGLARRLSDHHVELWATSGTRTVLEAAGIDCHPAEKLTGIGAWFGGRIKTLHPGILGGILAPPTPEGDRELTERGLLRFDLVVVNLYPFERRESEGASRAELVEAIDIGGVTLARAAAKNHAAVTVVSDPSDYDGLTNALTAHDGAVPLGLRQRFAASTFRRTSEYDRRIAAALGPASDGEPFPVQVGFDREPIRLRYGENPHQKAAVYRFHALGTSPMEPSPFSLLKGEPLSFTNLLDLETALGIVSEFPDPTAAVVKHATPCGAASGTTPREALRFAVETDPVARYGCVIAINRPVEAADVDAIHGIFVDLLAAPAVAPDALELLSKRAKLKVVRVAPPDLERPRWEAHSALGRLLLQEADRRQLAPGDFRSVTTQSATPKQSCSLDFAWRVVRHAKSNAVVLADGSRTVGIGGGQPTRVKAVELAVQVAGERSRGSVLASDAFFPFADGVDVAGAAGVAAIIQPGGSLRDPEVIAAAERHRMAMYFTGWRVFRH